MIWNKITHDKCRKDMMEKTYFDEGLMKCGCDV